MKGYEELAHASAHALTSVTARSKEPSPSKRLVKLTDLQDAQEIPDPGAMSALFESAQGEFTYPFRALSHLVAGGTLSLPREEALQDYDRYQSHPVASTLGSLAGMAPAFMLAGGITAPLKGMEILSRLRSLGLIGRMASEAIPLGAQFGATEALQMRPRSILPAAGQGAIFGSALPLLGRFSPHPRTPEALPPALPVPSEPLALPAPPEPLALPMLPESPVNVGEPRPAPIETPVPRPPTMEDLVATGRMRPLPQPVESVRTFRPGQSIIAFRDEATIVDGPNEQGIYEVKLKGGDIVPIHWSDLSSKPFRTTQPSPRPREPEPLREASLSTRPVTATVQRALRPLAEHQKRLVTQLREAVAAGEAGHRIQTETGEWIGIPSTFPDFFKNKGYTKEESLGIIDKVMAGHPITDHQRMVFDDLLKGQEADYAAELSAERQRLIAEGKDPSVLNQAQSAGEAEAQSESTQTTPQGAVAPPSFPRSPSSHRVTPSSRVPE